MYAMSEASQLSDSNRRIINPGSSSKRVYQVWRGSNRFFLGGRLIFGPDVRSLVFTILLIVIPVVLFSIFVCRELINEFHHVLGRSIISIAVVFTVYDICILFITSGRDPGIIPRNVHPPEPEDGSVSAPASWSGTQASIPTIPPTKDVIVNGFTVQVKYCHTCMLYRPPRCSHCSICNNCIERFDHHCPWVGQCIGKRNYRFFLIFVSSTTVLCFYVFAFCWINIRMIMEARDCNIWSALVQSPFSSILILYTFVAAWFVGGLTAFHLYLICTNQTTYENFRYHYNGKSNPYNLGCIRNFIEVFFTSIPRSKNNFRAKATEDSCTFDTSRSMGHVPSQENAKNSFGIEIGGKRQTVDAEEFEDIQNRFDLERCRPEREHAVRDEKGNWDMMPDIEELAAEFGMNHGFKYRDKIHGSLSVDP